jgi:hypothetical protein
MKVLKLLFPILFLFINCNDDIEIISINREGSLSFWVEGYDDIWTSNTINVFPGPSTVKTFTGTKDETVIFRRYFIIFEGDIPTGGTFELTVTVDLAIKDNMKNTYTTEYSKENGGLSQISLITIKGNNTSLAELCDDTAGDANFKILRQEQTEKLIAGTFEADLCLHDSPGTRLVIYDAEFKDIIYQ